MSVANTRFQLQALDESTWSTGHPDQLALKRGRTGLAAHRVERLIGKGVAVDAAGTIEGVHCGSTGGRVADEGAVLYCANGGNLQSAGLARSHLAERRWK